MIHHVAIDVPGGDLDAAVAFWSLLGYAEVPVPPTLSGGWRWVERAGTQIHLRPVAGGAAGGGWHVAVVVDDYAEAVRALEQGGFTVQPGTEHWGEQRGKTTAPGGAAVELMAAPPPQTRPRPRHAERSSVVARATTDARSTRRPR